MLQSQSSVFSNAVCAVFSNAVCAVLQYCALAVSAQCICLPDPATGVLQVLIPAALTREEEAAPIRAKVGRLTLTLLEPLRQ